MIVRFVSVVILYGATLAAFADEPPFPNIGILIIAGLECGEDRVTEELPEESVQYYLTTEEFYRLVVSAGSVQSQRLPYPDIPWMSVFSNLPDEPPGCRVGLGIQRADLSVAKYAMKRFRINVGTITAKDDFYYLKAHCPTPLPG